MRDCWENMGRRRAHLESEEMNGRRSSGLRLAGSQVAGASAASTISHIKLIFREKNPVQVSRGR